MGSDGEGSGGSGGGVWRLLFSRVGIGWSDNGLRGMAELGWLGGDPGIPRKEPAVKSILCASVFGLALVAGCSNDKKADTGSKDSLAGIAPPPPVHTESVSSGPVTPVDYGASVESGAAHTGPVRGQKYVVQKGDTLYSLARKTYGDPKQYPKIVAANPTTIKNDRLIAGTTIVLP